MTYEEWKSIKKINGEDNKKVIRDFERKNPMLAAMFREKEQEEYRKMQDIMEEPDRMKRWKAIAQATHDPEHLARRRYEEM